MFGSTVDYWGYNLVFAGIKKGIIYYLWATLNEVVYSGLQLECQRFMEFLRTGRGVWMVASLGCGKESNTSQFTSHQSLECIGKCKQALISPLWPSTNNKLHFSLPVSPQVHSPQNNNPKQQTFSSRTDTFPIKKQTPSAFPSTNPLHTTVQPLLQNTSEMILLQYNFNSLSMHTSKQNALSLLFQQLTPKLKKGFAQAIFTEALMVRHAESQFNKYVHLPTSFLQESLRTNLHHNIRLIDCSLSKEGHLQAQRAHLPSAYIQKSREVDILFVSPLTRALETAELLIKANRLVVKHVIVLPELTEVLSKICDLSSPIQEKRRRFKQFDFSQMTRFLRENCYRNQEEWQDGQVDPDYQSDILNKEKYGLRYLGILKKIFPVPLESSERCFQRSLKALEVMKLHTAKHQAKRVLVVSHNRVLKYLDGRFAKDKATSFQNCQMRKLTF